MLKFISGSTRHCPSRLWRLIRLIAWAALIPFNSNSNIHIVSTHSQSLHSYSFVPNHSLNISLTMIAFYDQIKCHKLTFPALIHQLHVPSLTHPNSSCDCTCPWYSTVSLAHTRTSHIRLWWSSSLASQAPDSLSSWSLSSWTSPCPDSLASAAAPATTYRHS